MNEKPDSQPDAQPDSKPDSRPGSVGGQSVLVEIERLIGTKFRVKLKDLSEDQGPDVAVGEVDLPIRDIGRYQTIGEIARGGVGVVVRCRDMDLGRDVAMKVIRDEHVGNQVTLQRFVEEAQVGGQLQHPGVVPVYELGLREDGRPYFTMKLIKGKTLSALLTDRKEPTDDLRKFLRIFEQICHTLAFAHARGVVHRDLKPANLLIGSFGEVMVSDWGFAKVL
ncbi:MAG: serine/threonine-protein kinase, partial [Planctomycetota bacterium]